ncbi:MAG: bifunctional precorrin-2 dehydrogenase/sirohydrochlorin ferrochelatase [Paenibacillaceae bacterium]|jgi:precorrin-2 dehydrogenase/sirohydrochlorin ferrochelatase|nr:bifunctional precorrin-2 dehydrogenase/sirohydrochlorin ferrochelatase [Paenibacillaceae bacterium]
MLEGYFPILLKLENKPCFVAGGGLVAERRIASLLEAKAKVKVVSPAFTDAILQWADEGLIEAIVRLYEPEDQDGAYLVIAATNSAEVNERIRARAAASGQLVNMAERPERGDFIVPSVVRRGKLVIAVSTLGASPIVAASIRREIEASFGEEYEIYLDFLSEFRLKVQELVKDTKVRQECFRTLLQADLLGMIRSGRFEGWKRQVLEELHANPAAFSAGQIGGETCAESL